MTKGEQTFLVELGEREGIKVERLNDIVIVEGDPFKWFTQAYQAVCQRRMVVALPWDAYIRKDIYEGACYE